MSLSKKSMIALSFTIGAFIFVTTAVADTMIGSDYDRFKGSLQHTTTQMEKGLDNYTVEALFTLKENNKTLYQSTTTSRNDMVKQALEEITLTQGLDGKTTPSYSYRDNKVAIVKYGDNDKYEAQETDKNVTRGELFNFTNTVEQDSATQIVNIIDSVVGNLNDDVQVEEKPDGGKVYSGTWSRDQVPVLVDAFSLIRFKAAIEMMGLESGASVIESDLFIKKVTGTAVENKAGLLENVTGNVIVSGKDKDGKQQDLTLDVVVKLTDIGNTKFTMPVLTDTNVEWRKPEYAFINKSHYVGKYKNDIVVDKKGKIGERTLEITSMEMDKVAGKYYETVKPGYEAHYPEEKYNFIFEFNPKETGSFFTYTNAKGMQESGQMGADDETMYLNLNIEIFDKSSFKQNPPANYNGEFKRVLEQ
ncbi:hypothetical protein [Paenibacillus assamensis]|uniref:hypothetical protein n=1 Tax=Paenibacillus assamensis TaxID=311244 RepID=UPI000410A427|nr:hypothetical protein [Paenibacillus assamensis]